jgi:hypothetical protein
MGELTTEGLRVLEPNYLADDFEPSCWLSPEWAEHERAVAERRSLLRLVPNPPSEKEPPP